MNILTQVTTAVNDFDPLNLFPHAPPCEYASEIEDIATFVVQNPFVDVVSLRQKIYEVFSHSFGAVFTRSVHDCELVAQKILSNRQ